MTTMTTARFPPRPRRLRRMGATPSAPIDLARDDDQSSNRFTFHLDPLIVHFADIYA
jgi:hypothetical protein